MSKVNIIAGLVLICFLVDVKLDDNLQNDNSSINFDLNIINSSGQYKAYNGGVLQKKTSLNEGYYLDSYSSNGQFHYLFVMQYDGVVVFLQQDTKLGNVTVLWRNGAASNSQISSYKLFLDASGDYGVVVVSGDRKLNVTVGTFSSLNCDLNILSGKLCFFNCDTGRDGFFVID